MSAGRARDVLESVIWRNLPAGTPGGAGAVDAILAAATAYAVAFAADAGTAERRRELARQVQAPGLKPCGTRAAAVRHRRHGEPLCAACVRAEREEGRRRARERARRLKRAAREKQAWQVAA